jgi:hypothetical protein
LGYANKLVEKRGELGEKGDNKNESQSEGNFNLP